MTGTCELCGKEFKNIGVHMFQAHGISPLKTDADYVEEKNLSKVITDIRAIINQFQSQLTVQTIEKGGKTAEVTITVKITI